YKPVALRPGSSYTLSAYLKCAEPDGQVGLLLGTFPEKQQKAGMFTGKPATETFRVGQEWKRYELRIPGLPPSAPVEGNADLALYYVALTPGAGGSTFWIDAVQLEEGETARPFSTGKPTEVSLASNRPGNLFYPGETIVPAARIYAPGVKQPLEVTCRVVDLLDGEIDSSRQTVTVPPDGHATVNLKGIAPTRRAWLTFEATVSCAGREEKEYLNAAVIEKAPPPLADQPCQLGFDFNMLTSADVVGPGEPWAESNIHLNLDRVFQLAPQAGVRWLRMAGVFFWEGRRSCETAPGQFAFHDDAVAAARAYGFELMGTLGNANARADFCPEWAEAGKNSRGSALPKLEDWRRYIRTMVDHYKNDIKSWEIINEPNTAFFAAEYLPLLKAAYEEAKAADPSCRVVGICATSDQSGDPYGYVRAVAEGGGVANVDAVSAHTLCKGRPWQSRGEAMSWDYIASLMGMLKEYAPQRTLPVWNTEGIKYAAWTDRPNIPHATADYAAQRMNKNMALPQRLAAAYAIRDCAIEYASGLSVLFLWEFRNALVNANIAQAGALGLMDWFSFDGTPHAKFVAMNAFAQKMRGARPVEQFGLSPQARCAVFDSPAGPFALLWRENRDESDMRSYILPVAAPVETQDLFGRPMKTEERQGAVQVPVSETPVYVAGPKGLGAGDLAAALREAGRKVDFGFDSPLENPLIRRGNARQ
ncbi:MAG: hypothetical protein NTW86_00700, partial [Candidatus Sumerlaeota bacterium]|nr:hypothetical protein [Candidatus Sumerlaeota bacterium]